MLGARTTANSYARFGTLGRMPLAGGSPRPMLEDVWFADWTSDGRELMVSRAVGDKQRIEFPPGKVLYETTGRINTPRLSPRGDTVAFFENGSQTSLGRTEIRVIDLKGSVRTLASVGDWWNLAWSPDGKEIWFSAPEPDAPVTTESLQAVSLSGKRRLLLRFPGILELHDISRDGRVLLARVSLRPQLMVLAPGEAAERDLTWLDTSILVDLSADGKTLLISEEGEGAGSNPAIYLRKTDGSPATLIGEGHARSLSPDGQWVFAARASGDLVLLPTGTGSSRKLKVEGMSKDTDGEFFPDGKQLLLQDNAPGRERQVYVVSVEGGKPRPLAPKGFKTAPFGNPISHDGKLVALLDTGGKVFLFPTSGGNGKPVPNLEAGEFPIQWSAEGRFLYTHRGGELPAKIWRYELATGRKELFKELSPADPSGVTSIEAIQVTPDGRSYAYFFAHNLSDLYIVDGLR
jgi:WD40 repeat protein